MKNKKLFKGILLLTLFTLLCCGLFMLKKSVLPPEMVGEAKLKLIFKAGVGAKNELNTFQGTFTKDMVRGPSVTVNLSLSDKELDKIYKKMIEIDFFNYPDVFSAPPKVIEGAMFYTSTPFSSCYFKVEYGSTLKELRWDDDVDTENEKALKLRELMNLIIRIVESKAAYKKLPPPRAAYL